MQDPKTLKPCPFCGGDAGHLMQRWSGTEYHSVKCDDCQIWQDSRSQTPCDAAERWNTRAATEIEHLQSQLNVMREAIKYAVAGARLPPNVTRSSKVTIVAADYHRLVAALKTVGSMG